MRARMSRRSSGFTLVEILVATAIFAVIMVAALMMYDKNQQVFKQSVEAADLQQNTRVAFDKMVAEIRMAGFDYDRDGVPSLAGQSEQPDEQIEYANTRAVTIRGNFDYDSNMAGDADNGRETAWESGKFPVVTTGNDEIVAYALHSKNAGAGANPSTITFKVDVNKPRNGTETTINIDNVDITGTNPPYELQRISLDPTDGTKFIRTTIADNIRDMKFDYFTDLAGAAANQITTMPLGVDANIATRATIRSIHVELTGMNANADVAYVNPTETDTTVTTAKNFRTYKLESLLVPRNLGLKGMQEVEATSPGAASITGLCVGACGFVNVKWDPPSAGASVTSYTITYDVSATGAFLPVVPLGNVLQGWAGPTDPTKAYYYKIRSLNGYGSNSSASFGPVFATNKTKSKAPGAGTGPPADVLTATSDANTNALGDEIQVVWTNPTENLSGTYGSFGGSTSCPSPPPAAKMPSLNEVTTYKVYRSLTSGFTPTDTGVNKNLIWTGGLSGGILDRDASNNLTFHDVSPVGLPGYPLPKLNCIPYYYKIVAVEPCAIIGTTNDNDDAAAVSAPSAEISGNSIAKTVPKDPTGLTAVGSCVGTPPICAITLNWTEVTQDASSFNIQISNYLVHRQTYMNGVLQSPEDDKTAVVVPGAPTWPDPDLLPLSDVLGNFYQYRYTIKASQCAGASVSDLSNVAIFPCANFTISPPAAGVLNGSGAASDPYLITTPSGTFTVNATASVSAVTVAVTNMTSGTLITPAPVATVQNAPTNTIWSFSVPLSANDGSRYKVDVTVTDTANACTSTNTIYVEDSPASCCLDPFKLADNTTVFNNTVLTLNAATNTVRVNLVNECASNLTITGLEADFTNDKGNPGTSLALTKINFNSPVGLGTQDFGLPNNGQQPNVTLPGTAALPSLPANVRVIAASTAGKSYTIDLVFRNRPATLADILGVCITYTDASGTAFSCRIAPNSGTSCP